MALADSTELPRSPVSGEYLTEGVGLRVNMPGSIPELTVNESQQKKRHSVGG